MITISSFEKTTGIHFTLKHTGKMEGMQSLSTSCRVNPFCMERAKNPDSICSKCFAQTMMDRYGDKFQDCFEKNTEILTGKLFEITELPVINAEKFRLESFGDLVNSTQVRNYFRLCKRNPHVKFALWSKNMWLIDMAIKAGETKPKNLVIIESSPFMNTVAKKSFDFVDKTFTVYKTVADAERDGKKINCGSRKCLECGRCYSKRTTDEIVELVK